MIRKILLKPLLHLLYLSLGCCSLSSTSWAKSLALSFDDGLNPAVDAHAGQINQQILATLQQHQLHAIVYPSLSKIGATAGFALIEQWGQHGHSIGNHGKLHLNLHHASVTLEQYLQDITDGHQAFSQLHGFVPRFRFPYLKEGNTAEKRAGVQAWLNQHQYQSGAVSIDASDFGFIISYFYATSKHTI